MHSHNKTTFILLALFNMLDDVNREGWCIDVGLSLPSARVNLYC